VADDGSEKLAAHIAYGTPADRAKGRRLPEAFVSLSLS
jgi:hypothetical protein